MTAERTCSVEYLASVIRAIVTGVEEILFFRVPCAGYQNNVTVTAGPSDANEAGRVNLVAGGDGALRPD